ncbi:MAG: ribonuclease H family protein [Candidatus Cohnella colombiensis]|uniref:Ribonuclease H n=1 Tax=Candidatus Cohnella colombiensis TaxID=3121368 RepID=A0AA95F0Q4_9BACL|nr:MAG: ribonuclease H family protein [Cohnella sp.]
MAKQKYYVVWVGKVPGVYTSWSECQEQVNQFTDAKYKSYESKSEAETAYQLGWKKSWGLAKAGATKDAGKPKKTTESTIAMNEQIDYNSISVDVGTHGNPGPVEYKGVDTQTGDILFSYGPIRKGTNNLGEFLAIVHGLAYLQKLGSDKTIYSDSVNALKWVKQKAVSSTLVRDESTAEIWQLVDRAVLWLKTNSYKNKVTKWQTKEWGEIKADYGRKS